MLFITSIYIVALAFSISFTDPEEHDAYLRSAIVGTWKADEPFRKGEATYYADAHFQTTVLYPERITIIGTWSVEKGRLILTSFESDPPVIKRGSKSIDRIQSVTDEQLVLISSDGSAHVRIRIERLKND